MSRSLFAINIFSLATFQEELAGAQFCIDGAAGPLLGRAERSTPEARRVAPKARGVDGGSARRATIMSPAITLQVSLRFC